MQRGVHSAFSDVEAEFRSVIAEGDEVAVHVTLSMTHTGTLMGIEPIGRRVSVGADDGVLPLRQEGQDSGVVGHDGHGSYGGPARELEYPIHPTSGKQSSRKVAPGFGGCHH